MIYSKIIHYNECCSTGDNDLYSNTKNTIAFDSENLIIQAEKVKGGGEICTILFTLSDELIIELKNLISTIEIMDLEQ